MGVNKRVAEAKDAIINMHVNGIATNAISRTLRIAPITIRRVLDEWRTTVGVVASGRAKLSAAIEPACETVAQAVKRDDKAAFRLLEGMGVLGVDKTGALTDKSINISINSLLHQPSTHTTPSNTVSTSLAESEPSSRKGPTPTMQLHDGAQNFSEIVDVDENKGVSEDGLTASELQSDVSTGADGESDQ